MRGYAICPASLLLLTILLFALGGCPLSGAPLAAGASPTPLAASPTPAAQTSAALGPSAPDEMSALIAAGKLPDLPLAELQRRPARRCKILRRRRKHLGLARQRQADRTSLRDHLF